MIQAALVFALSDTIGTRLATLAVQWRSGTRTDGLPRRGRAACLARDVWESLGGGHPGFVELGPGGQSSLTVQPRLTGKP